MRCLRCGTEHEEDRSFCSSCARRMKEPLEDTPYLHTQIVLPNRQATPAPKRPEPKKEGKKHPWGWILTAVLSILLCATLLLQGGWYFGAWLKTQAALQETERERLELQETLALLEGHLAEAMQSNIDLQKEYSELEAELIRTQVNFVDLQQKLQELSRHIVFLKDEEATVFHRQGCVKLDMDSFRALIRDDAVRKGYTPCELCLP